MNSQPGQDQPGQSEPTNGQLQAGQPAPPGSGNPVPAPREAPGEPDETGTGTADDPPEGYEPL